ncbi:TonB-dependent receptor [Lentimicrobium sp.]|jgi:hypothetical protein|uniref:TonB-dependent receptor n=1 Tax=Lentimicrobium sp. TaxID=2034841 RepID=UPI002BDDCE9E|nr:TonB-dependent receptor [Lentimicrobium sp.]HRW69797.1 TonB-dependent receptor [Lentimicrobium sp.]
MRSIKLFLVLLLTTSMVAVLHAQNGFIRGSVFDDATGETLPGVTIFAEGTTNGTLTDFDGKFNLSIAPGTYNLRISFISYETINLKNIKVEAGKVSLFENLRLKEAKIELTEVTITAEAVRNSEVALLTMKQKSANLIDGISAANFRKIGDSDAASSMKRVAGVSVEGGKYVYVRGLGDRYSKTILNGMDIPGIDPDRNTVQMDLFPTNIVDNIIVHKSFSAYLPADFTGGVVDIETKDFPELKTGNVSLNLGYNPEFHFNKDYLTYEGGKNDFLGFDDGTRAIPATDNIPQFSEVAGNPDGEKGLRYKEILKGFNTVMGATRETSLMDFSLGVSVGNQIPKNKVTWGYNASLSYKNTTEYYKNAEYGRYGVDPAKPDFYEMEYREFQKGDYGVNSVMLSAMAGIAMKTKYSKFRLNILHLQNGEKRAGIFNYSNSDLGAVFEGVQHNLEYTQRSMTNVLLNGKHMFSDNNWQIEWKLSPSLSKLDDPDIRFTRYEIKEEKYIIGTEAGFPERIWRELDEVSLTGNFDISRNLLVFGSKSQLRFGGLLTRKDRSFIIRNFQLNVRNIPLTGDPDELFFPENLWPYNGNASRGTTFETPFIPVNPNQFDANNLNTAGYLSWEVSPLKYLKLIVGVRTEMYQQRYTGQNQLGDIVLDNEKVLDDLDVFPAANVIFSLNQSQNLRFSYSKTIARPSMKELSFAEIFDAITGRTFIGGLFTDANDQLGITYWDGNLTSTRIDNLDVRWEMFGKGGQTISFGAFYKYFKDPIEIVQYFTQAGAFQPRNVGDGQLLGLEAEFRKNLDFLFPSLSGISLSSNFTYSFSRIRLSSTEYESRLANARTGETIDEYRSMAGQAPFIINAGLAYDGSGKGIFNGLEAGLYYNVQGPTLEVVGIADRPDVYSRSFNSLNLNINKTFGESKKLQLGLKIENILGDVKESVFQSFEAADQFYTYLNQGRTIQLRLGYRFF